MYMRDNHPTEICEVMYKIKFLNKLRQCAMGACKTLVSAHKYWLVSVQ